MNKNTGGPAFPVTVLGETIKGQEGMTLRDHFAGLAMQGALSGCAVRNEVVINTELSELAYELADAMLAEREKGNEN